MTERAGYAASVAAAAVAYFLFAKLSLSLAIPPGYATALWPPSGIALALLLLYGVRIWPGVWIAATLVNFTVGESLPSALAIGVGNTLEMVIATQLVLRRAPGIQRGLATTSEVMVLFTAAAASAAVAASMGTAALWMSGEIPVNAAWLTWLTWWLGDVVGMIVFAPLILSWATGRRPAWWPERALELSIATLLLLFITFGVFGAWLSQGRPLPVGFGVLPFVVWVAIRFGVREVSTLTAAAGLLSVLLTVHGSGPFIGQNGAQALLLLQAFVGTLTVTGLLLTTLVEERARALESMRRSQEDLEQFVYGAAHDMQEPLRTIVNFSDLLEARHGTRLDPEARDYLQFIQAGARRMHRRVQDLLEFSRVSHGALAVSSTDSSEALDEALAALEAPLRETGARVTHGDMPRVDADGRLLVHLFQNLVANALKFRRAGEVPHVHVSATVDSRGWVFGIRDNGIGIAEAHADRIFGLFQRLNSADLYPGSGMGLAMCRRIVERHGGQIWLESSRPGSTTFQFSIPAREGREHARSGNAAGRNQHPAR